MKKILLLSLSILFLSCQSNDIEIPEFALEPADEFSEDEYDVYSAILGNFSNTQVVIKQQTTSRTPVESAFELFFNLDKMSNMEATLFSNYEAENAETSLLGEELKITAKETYLLSNEEHRYFFDQPDLKKSWLLFQKKYPTSGTWYFILNKIGFNADGTQAIVGIQSYWYMDSDSEPTQSTGRLHYLEKINDSWEEIGSAGYSLDGL
ncbi:hypothetical protein SanaruYs_28090 [Chryseotalea sanaruensis]|uniref:Uncharacterized protein n=1 Tax=Chryseotalea sanaruensis TaxID=2482724 RepID=A0A401UCG9_9BACT|nr:hypothetical protein [Chryseotalea sanaruensis]GCC52572.1 hypothetical protein SanaruYs_28090 [Chryseotalea sanaruensis]